MCMRVKFDDEFRTASQGAFPMLKFHSATYQKAARKLVVRFMIEAGEAKNFHDEQRKKVADIVAAMFKGIDSEVQYIRTYADEETVRTRIYAFFNEKNRMVYRYLGDDTVKVKVESDGIKVDLYFDTPTADFLEAGSLPEHLSEWLYYSFNPPSFVAVHRTGMPEKGSEEDDKVETAVFSGFSARLVDITVKEKIYERGNIGGIRQKPGYVADLTAPSEMAVVCGKVSGLSVREYRNKKFDPSAPKKQPEMLQMVRFSLDDTTGLMECVCFPTPAKVPDLEKIQNGDTVVCLGKAGLSAHTGAISVAVNAVFRCEIDYDSLKVVNTRPVPSKYRCIKPEAYVAPEVLKSSLIAYAEDDGEKKRGEDTVPRGLLGKTFVVFDFEATDANMSAVPIELAALKIVDGVPTETFGSLLDPGIPIPAKITSITSITDSMVEGKPSIIDVLPDFYKFTRGAVLVGHNVDGYDFPLLRKYADKEGYLFDNETCDTLLLARRYIGEVHRFSLEELTKHFGIYHANAHRAMADVYATADLLKILYRRMESGN